MTLTCNAAKSSQGSYIYKFFDGSTVLYNGTSKTYKIEHTTIGSTDYTCSVYIDTVSSDISSKLSVKGEYYLWD